MGFLLQPGFPLVPPSTDSISPPPPHADPFNVLPVLSQQQGNHLSPSPAFTADAVDWGNHDIFSPSARDDSESALIVSAGAANANGDPRPLSSISCGTRLSHLRMQLSLHLQQCLEDSGGFWDDDTDANAKAHHQQQRQHAVRNPFGEALCYTSELLSIIRSFMYQQSLGDASLSPSPSSSVSGTIDLVTMLDILSAHTQMVSIYDELFQRLYARLRVTVGPDGRGSSGSSPSSSSSAPAAQSQPQFQALPGLQLAGFPVHQGTLQIKILMQAIMHQFETLERELSLPAELRVSKRTDTYPGGLIGRDPRTRHVVNSFFASSLQNSTEHVTSLRTTIDQLSRVLDL